MHYVTWKGRGLNSTDIVLDFCSAPCKYHADLCASYTLMDVREVRGEGMNSVLTQYLAPPLCFLNTKANALVIICDMSYGRSADGENISNVLT